MQSLARLNPEPREDEPLHESVPEPSLKESEYETATLSHNPLLDAISTITDDTEDKHTNVSDVAHGEASTPSQKDSKGDSSSNSDLISLPEYTLSKPSNVVQERVEDLVTFLESVENKPGTFMVESNNNPSRSFVGVFDYILHELTACNIESFRQLERYQDTCYDLFNRLHIFMKEFTIEYVMQMSELGIASPYHSRASAYIAACTEELLHELERKDFVRRLRRDRHDNKKTGRRKFHEMRVKYQRLSSSRVHGLAHLPAYESNFPTRLQYR
ncbi:hypothetical protein GMRT_15198 [Giardia muris]|uniref:Uncharacterized protein n=1 Tax=Giardia muris TaxID=5742 RepID=A0A4Z1SQK3_GIAMU|nr:hypothetical protein GMRT_15198 [Giardia muris]|eukprot:TNJ28134.1 hypothetical protein GMRT_15198 [Giardia muris]